jgi:redox-sensitive bicupin YhaK (pirin superfamily)
MKTLAFVHRNDTRFAVGGFSPVLSVFSYHELGSTVSPFLLLDHIGPGKLLPSTKRRGVDDHPHRGFETVTIVYAGELEHRDSAGHGGLIRAGDVQWMTAASGLVHQELFSDAFTQRGGPFEMIQLWVNLPAADKMGPPGYQNLTRADIPVLALPDDAGTVRVIAGAFDGMAGPAATHTRMNVFDVQLAAGTSATFPCEDGDTALVYLRSGRLQLAADEVLEENAMAVLSAHGAGVAVTATEASRLLVLSGARIDEPINGHGPFVMNSYDEILQAYDDIKTGRFGIQPGA